MTGIVFYFHAHQPRRIRYFSFFDIGNSSNNYFNDEVNKRILDRVVNKCYRPALQMILNAVYDYDLKFSFSITGTLIEQLEIWHPEIIDLWKELIDTGNVEILGEPYYHSVAYLIDKEEFKEQIKMHIEKIKKTFNYTPKAFRNFELAYNNEIGEIAYSLGFHTALIEGTEKVLKWRSPNYVYKAKGINLRLLPRNYRLSDDIAFRFGNPYWEHHPLTAEKYFNWLLRTPGDLINIFMDFETIGEHLWPESGIFEFFKHLFKLIGKSDEFETYTVSEAAYNFYPADELDISDIISWADLERDLSAWVGDNIQNEAFEYLRDLFRIAKESKNYEILKILRYLSTSDNLYYMSLKYSSDGDIHKYFREEAFATPYDAFLSFMNILRDIEMKLSEEKVINK